MARNSRRFTLCEYESIEIGISPGKAGRKMGKKSEAVKRRNRRLAFVILIALLGLLAVIFVIIGVMGMIERGRQTASSASSASQTAPSGGADSSDENADGTTVSTNGATTGPTSKPTSKPTAKTTAGSDGLLPVAKYVQKNRSVWNLILVNDYNPLPENFESTIHIADFRGPGKQCDARIVEPLNQMIKAGAAYNLTPISMFRSRELQTKLYNNEVAKWQGQGYSLENAKIKAATVVKRPGESEHNTGLTLDILGSGHTSLTESFEKTPAFKWLVEHCAEYGFILRYPKGKENITAVIYEPWHYRYVGVEAAKEIMSRDITLEEYIQEKGM